MSARFLRRFVGHHEEADLASYLLFEGGFAEELIELGRADARASHAELVVAVGSLVESRARAKHAATTTTGYELESSGRPAAAECPQPAERSSRGHAA
jgi:NTE family protein